MNRGINRPSASAVLLLFLLAAPVAAGRDDFVGSKRCGACHQQSHRAWKSGPHAAADRSLGEQRGERRCAACHTTGDAPAGRPFFGGVGCEACHGPGAGYAPADVMRNPILARDLGLRDLSTPARRAALCSGCHRAGTTLERFDAEAAWQRIAHP